MTVAMVEKLMRARAKIRAPWSAERAGTLVDHMGGELCGERKALVPTLATEALELADCAADLLDLLDAERGYAGQAEGLKAREALMRVVVRHLHTLKRVGA